MASEENPVDRVPPDGEALAQGYQARDERVATFAVVLAGVAVLFVAMCGGLWAFYRFELKGTDVKKAPPSAVSTSILHGDAPPLQPQVGHDSLDAWDLAKMRGQEDWVFERLGWARDEHTHRFVAPPDVLSVLQKKQATTQPVALPNGGR